MAEKLDEKLNKLVKTGSNYLKRFVNFLGYIFKNPEESSAEEELAIDSGGKNNLDYTYSIKYYHVL